MAGKETSAGRVLLIPKGVFTSGTNYTPLDFVAFGSNNYVCKKATDGTKTPVEDTASWQMLAAGFDSHNIAAEYSEEATYHTGDICISGGNLYKAKQDINVAEAFTAGHWEEITVGNELTAIETGLATKAAASDVTTLEEKVGTTALTTTATDLSGAVNEVKAATDTNANAITNLMLKAKLLANLSAKIAIVTTIKLNDDILNYDAILIQFWAVSPSDKYETRKFACIDTQFINDVGLDFRYAEGSIFYSDNYYAAVGICYPNSTTMIVKEISINGYTDVCIGNVYGVHLK